MMLWRWLQEWRDRRATLAEMDELHRADEALFMGQNQNPLNLARVSVESGDFVAAASHWERARTMMPNAVRQAPETVDILIALERYDECEALMRERLKRDGGDRVALIGLAKAAEGRREFDEGVKRWHTVRRRVNDTVDGYMGCARCLVELGRYDDADKQWSRAIRHDPSNWLTWLGHARVPERRKDWAESLKRWQYVADRFRYGPAFAFAAKAMIQLGRVDEADAYLEEPLRLIPGDLEIAVTHAHLAKQRGDLALACTRWERVRKVNPHFQSGYQEGARCFSEAGRHAEADALLAAAIERFPNEVWVRRDYAQQAHDRNDWDAAIERWSMLRQRFPDEPTGWSRGAEALKAAGRTDEAAALQAN